MRQILIAEAHTEATSLLRAFLGSRFEYHRSDTLLGAQTLLASIKFQLVVVDLDLPRHVGFEIVSRAKQLQPTIPIIAISEESSIEVRKADLQPQVSGLIYKPVQAVELEQAVRHAIGFWSDPRVAGDSQNRRVAARYEVHAEARLSSVLVFDNEADHVGDDELLIVVGYTHDISESGLGIVVPEASLDVQGIIGRTFHIVLGLSTGSLDIEAKAVRCERIAAGYLVGAAITNMNGRDRMHFLEYLYMLSKDK